MPKYWTAKGCNKNPILPNFTSQREQHAQHRKVFLCVAAIISHSPLNHNMAGSPEVAFLFQFGNLRDIVTTNVGSLTLNKLKDLACDFINSKVSLFIPMLFIFMCKNTRRKLSWIFYVLIISSFIKRTLEKFFHLFVLYWRTSHLSRGLSTRLPTCWFLTKVTRGGIWWIKCELSIKI